MSWRCLTRLTYTIKWLQVQQEMQLAVCFGERCLWQKAYCGIQTLLLGTNYYSSRHAPAIVHFNKRKPGLKISHLRCWFYLLWKLKKKNQLPNNTKVIFPFCFSIEFLEHKSHLKVVPLMLIYIICKHHCRINWMLSALNLTDTLISSE